MATPVHRKLGNAATTGAPWSGGNIAEDSADHAPPVCRSGYDWAPRSALTCVWRNPAGSTELTGKTEERHAQTHDQQAETTDCYSAP